MVGQIIRAQRKQLGLTLQQAAERAGLSKPTASRIERSSKVIAKTETYAKALGLDLHIYLVQTQENDQ